jgi:DNA helicase-2/ATP-dependent DNA helicase PcrA
MTDLVRQVVAKLQVEQDCVFNEEQLEFITAPPANIKSESLPGTGKTFSVINRMFVLELGYGIPGEKILAMSFTNMATAELELKHKLLCKKFGIMQTPRFSTIHSICTAIVKEYYHRLDIPEFKITEETTNSIADACDYLILKAKSELGLDIDAQQMRGIYNCIRSLNSSLIFDTMHIIKRKDFVRLHIKMSDFVHLRKKLYLYHKLMGIILLSDLPLYTLELLQRFPDISENYKSKYDTVIVDEYQDMSLLQLRIVSYIAKTLIVIGDINQQIYAFQGACPEISTEFNKYYPEFREIILRQSYRCSSKIADYSTKIILPNKFKSSKLFRGIEKPDSYVSIHKGDADLLPIIQDIAKEYNTPDIKPANHLFVFRNNRSSLKLSDMCYDYNIPCRVNNYRPLYQQPIMSDIVQLIYLLRSPTNTDYLPILSKFIYEFRNDRRPEDSPLFDIMSTRNMNFMDVPYDYDSPSVPRIMESFTRVKNLLQENAPFHRIFDILYPILYENHLKMREHYLSYNLKMVCNMIQEIAKNYSYDALIQRETQKAEFIKDYTDKKIGVRLYTFYAAKGLEGDHVYVIDADAGVIPNEKELSRACRNEAYREAAVTVRNERSACYVACTRAKDTLDIFYNTELAPIIAGQNPYENLDDFYENNPITFCDVEAFMDFYKDGI